MLGRASFDSITKMWKVERYRNEEPIVTANRNKYEICLYAPVRIPYCICIGLYNGLSSGFTIPQFIDNFLNDLVVKKVEKVEKSHKNKWRK